MNYKSETCFTKWREWEVRIGALLEVKSDIERKIKAAQVEQGKWRQKWFAASKREKEPQAEQEEDSGS